MNWTLGSTMHRSEPGPRVWKHPHIRTKTQHAGSSRYRCWVDGQLVSRSRKQGVELEKETSSPPDQKLPCENKQQWPQMPVYSGLRSLKTATQDIDRFGAGTKGTRIRTDESVVASVIESTLFAQIPLHPQTSVWGWKAAAVSMWLWAVSAPREVGS